ncbi:tRNA (adenosine(37)-N6)-threonylcarbamoyltransferase complex dimerization subunit type 1 TsaB [Pectinatus sottacetonis]|uniref:tRNA (adenosine(37)-N6)-threonylcarbamoyltransferase complex dimerization subunit type 1 TsaB n=1 Tax=Pectinatus sottacetonis TaxID=1002795 RepID=UPI0018C59041|nr:tRNA (adenosine(37)-N6)-threonylcarbamoyltransferase complex dimerization subunit type 1 TsaB [Pectinatus sottacetonis]
MPILAIDAATMVSSAAVAVENRLLSEVTMQLKKPQSEVLMGHIISALKIAHVDKTQLTAIAVNVGPGSFTGLRIGLAAAKMMAYTLKIPIIGVDIGEVLAYHYPVDNLYSAVFIDAQKNNVYFAIYNWCSGILQCVENMQVLSLPEAVQKCESRDKQVIAMGDIVQKKQDVFLNCSNTVVAPPYRVMPCAANTAFAGLEKLKRGEVSNVMNMEPLYIRRSEAEELWEKHHREE